MRYKVPQDTGVEDQIVGPLTMRQLLILGVGGVICYTAYLKLDDFTWPIVLIIVGPLTIAMAFVKIAHMPFYRYILEAIGYLIRPERRVWVKGADRVIDHNPPAPPKKKTANVGQALARDEEVLQNLADITHDLDFIGEQIKAPQIDPNLDEAHDDDLVTKSFIAHADQDTKRQQLAKFLKKTVDPKMIHQRISAQRKKQKQAQAKIATGQLEAGQEVTLP